VGWTIRHSLALGTFRGIRIETRIPLHTHRTDWRSVWNYQVLLLKRLGRIQDLDTHPTEYGDGRFHLCTPCPWSPEGLCAKLQIQVTSGLDLLRSSVRWQLRAGGRAELTYVLACWDFSFYHPRT